MSIYKSRKYSEKAELAELRKLAANVFGVKFDRITRSGAEANFFGIRSKDVLFSQRLDCRTVFIHDRRYGVGKAAGICKNSDQQQQKLARSMMKRFGIASSEIEEQKVVKEQTQFAETDSEGNAIHVSPVQQGKSFVRMTRQIKGLPVWSSNVMLGLTKENKVGFLQLHWPDIPAAVVREAGKLAHKVENGWRPASIPGAKPESIEAGIIHSPAAGLLIDVYPAIRVIYAPLDRTVGKKAVTYVDRHGKAVPIPRQADLTPQPYQPREREQSGTVQR